MSDHTGKETISPPPGDGHHEEFFRQGERGEALDDAEMAAAVRRRPPSTRNSLLMLAAVIVSIWFVWDIRSQLVYFFQSPEPINLGFAERLDRSRLKDGAFVTISGIPDPRKAQVDTTSFGILSKVQIWFAWMGSNDLLGREEFRELDMLRKIADSNHEYDSSPRSGRLYRFSSFPQTSELQEIRKYFKAHFDREFPADSWLLVVGESPRYSWQYPLLALLLLAFSCYNCVQLWRKHIQPLHRARRR